MAEGRLFGGTLNNTANGFFMVAHNINFVGGRSFSIPTVKKGIVCQKIETGRLLIVLVIYIHTMGSFYMCFWYFFK
jgi:hypothetical protein